MTGIEQKLKALEAFKDWSNYLLVTTVAAVGWISSEHAPGFPLWWVRALCIWAFALSIVFAIFTLALIPHVGEDIGAADKSIYTVYWRGYRVPLRLTHLCMPQHLLFIAGILLYAYGTFRA
jgi:uncharacterized membrane protein YhdT